MKILIVFIVLGVVVVGKGFLLCSFSLKKAFCGDSSHYFDQILVPMYIGISDCEGLPFQPL